MFTADICRQQMVVTVSEQCEQKIMALRNEEHEGKSHCSAPDQGCIKRWAAGL